MASRVEEAGWSSHADDTFVGTLGSVLERRRDGLTELALRTVDSHKNLSGIVHGGVVMTLLDRVVGINCRTASAGVRMATVSLTVNFLRQIRVGDFIEIRCRLRKKGRKAWFADAEVWVGERLAATATGLWLKIDG